MKREAVSLWLLLIVAPVGTDRAAAFPRQATPLAKTSFEEVSAGPFTALATGAGRWIAEEGHTVIDAAHARTGRQCLHLVGGEQRRVSLEPSTGADPVSEISFWAERWTRRDPFVFRVEGLFRGTWRELYVGDEEIVIGGFKTHVRFPVSAPLERLRFTCTSPSGVLIDDLRFGRAAPMELVSATATRPVVPCLVNKPANPVARIQLETTGNQEPLTVTELRVDLRGTTDLEDVASVEVLDPGGERFGRARSPAKELTFRGALPLQEGTNTLTVALTLTPTADLDHVVNVACEWVSFKSGTRIELEVADLPGARRFGLALRDAGDDGCAVYRIPGLATTPEGTLIAVYDVRWKGWADLPGDIDVGMSRSVDGGRTWEPMRIILDQGGDPAHRFDGVGDPAVLVDGQTGTVWVAAIWSHGNRGWNGSGPGLTPEETGQLLLTRSDDDGRTWSAPINITAEVKHPEWCFLLQGPGRGICLGNGTLVFAAQYQDASENDRIPHSTILFSRDHGGTWQLGCGVKSDTTEAQVAELEDGVLMLNMRDNRGGSRSVYTTSDLGRTWQEHPSSRRALVDPVCNAGLIRAGETTLVFSNPAVPRPPRRRMTLKASSDLGLTWPEGQQLLIDEGQSAGYSSLTMIDEETIGFLFEGSRAQLTFMRIPLEALVH